MEILATGKFLPIPKNNTETIHPSKATEPDNRRPTTGDEEFGKKLINMRSVSLAEINHLIKAGHWELLDIAPSVGPVIKDDKDLGSYFDVKIDFIGQVEAKIEFRKSIGEPTDFHEKFLEHLKNIDGTPFPGEIDVTA